MAGYVIRKTLSALVTLGIMAGAGSVLMSPSISLASPIPQTPGNELQAFVARTVAADVNAINAPQTGGYYGRQIHSGPVQCTQTGPLTSPSGVANYFCRFTIMTAGLSVTYVYKFHVDPPSTLGGWQAVGVPFAPFQIW